MIELKDVTVDYSGTVTLQSVSSALGTGTIAITGPSGSGKSTLLRLIAGLQRPDGGTVSIAGEAVRASSWRSSSDPRVSLVHQDYRLVPFLTVEENLLLAAELRGRNIGGEEVGDALARVGLPSQMRKRLPSAMSGVSSSEPRSRAHS